MTISSLSVTFQLPPPSILALRTLFSCFKSAGLCGDQAVGGLPTPAHSPPPTLPTALENPVSRNALASGLQEVPACPAGSCSGCACAAPHPTPTPILSTWWPLVMHCSDQTPPVGQSCLNSRPRKSPESLCILFSKALLPECVWCSIVALFIVCLLPRERYLQEGRDHICPFPHRGPSPVLRVKRAKNINLLTE